MSATIKFFCKTLYEINLNISDGEYTYEIIQGTPEPKDITTHYYRNITKLLYGKYGGSWVHPDLAVQIANWLSPTFALKISKWVRELAITGNVTIGQEKTNLQLLELQKEHKQIQNEL